MCHPRLPFATAILGALLAFPSCGGTVQESDGNSEPPDAAAPDAPGSDGSKPDAPLACKGPDPTGCFFNGIGCPNGQSCAAQGCAPSQCGCGTQGSWICTEDCGGGVCVELPDAGQDVHNDAGCPGPNPAGCFSNGIGCPAGQYCAAQGCAPSGCSCDESSGHWGCTADCGGGTCVYATDAAVDAGDCQAASEAIASQIKGFACTAVVRLDYSTYSMIGWQFVCGNFNQVDQNAARAIAQADTGYGYGQALSPIIPSDEHVFYTAPGDFGGVGVVSATSGLSVFGGSIVWAGTGDITWPKTGWNPPLSPAPDCVINLWPQWAGYDLEHGFTLQSAAFKTALTTVMSTALPMAMSQKLYIQNAVVLLYPRAVGAFSPDQAEWIVLLNANWLE